MKILKYILFLILSVIVIFVLSIKININDIAFEIIATFLSITTGFAITALSIIATSPFSRKLYKIESVSDNSKTLLHILVNKFKSSTILFVGTIGLIILFSFFPENYSGNESKIFHFSFYTFDLLKSLILYTTILSFYSFVNLFYTFSKFVIKTATE